MGRQVFVVEVNKDVNRELFLVGRMVSEGGNVSSEAIAYHERPDGPRPPHRLRLAHRSHRRHPTGERSACRGHSPTAEYRAAEWGHK